MRKESLIMRRTRGRCILSDNLPESGDSTSSVTVDKSVHEEDRSDNEEKDEDVKDIICQLLDQWTVSQRRDKSCTPSH